jgi:hypothetical protein
VAELTPIPTAQRASDADYQPLAGFAVAAMIVAVLFAVLLIVLLIMSFVSKRPTLAFEVLVLPVAGLIFAILGRRQILRSEGTRSGLKITNASWWICVLGGGGFLAYVLATSFVLERDATKLSDRFLTMLKTDRINNAFLETLDPSARTGASTDNADAFETEFGPKGLVHFRNLDVVRVIRRNKDVTWERLGSRDLAQEGGSFSVTQIYRVVCPEGTFEVTMGLSSKESRKGITPQWQIAGGRNPYIKLTTVQLSHYGQLILEAEQEADTFTKMWLAELNTGKQLQAHLLTLPQEYRLPYFDAIGGIGILGGSVTLNHQLTNAILPAERRQNGKMGAELSFDDLYANDFFQQDENKTPFPAEKFEVLRQSWRTPRIAPILNQRPVVEGQIPPDSLRTIPTPDRLLVLVPVEFFLRGSTVSYAKATIGVIAESEEFLKVLNEARSQGTNVKADVSRNLARSPDRQWRIAFVRTDLMPQSVITGPGAPGR